MLRKNKSLIFFVAVIIIFGIGAYLLITNGNVIDFQLHRKGILDNQSSSDLFKKITHQNLIEPTSMILLQIIAILVVSRIFSSLFAKIKQPSVIGEILAGIVLGPSLLGHFYPSAYHFLFSAQSLNNLYIISQIGLILFMFTVGMDLNISEMKGKIKNTFIISLSSIIIPFLLGMILAFTIYKNYSTVKSTFTSFGLFIGISMSITAFPVLARIVQEKGLSKTHLGTISIGSAAINDVTAWLLLVAVIAIAQTGSFASSIYTLLFTLVYILLMFFVVRPFVKHVGEIYQNEELMNKSIFGFFIMILIISAYTTQLLGIHALFGSFVAGLIMPSSTKFRKLMIDKVEDISISLLLPLFFVYTGLKTEIGLVNTPSLWVLCFVFIIVAILGKLIGSMLAAKAVGESWKDSLSIGVLMNTRGLMELIVLNIGLEMGILTPVIFTMLVIMALVTTFMTTPLLYFIEKIFPNKAAKEELIRQQAEGIFKTMIALGNPESGKNLLLVAKTVLDGVKNKLSVNVLHITAGTDTHPIYSEQFSVESFIDVQAASKALDIPISTEYKVSDNVEAEIVKKVNSENYDFLLVGSGTSLNPPSTKENKRNIHFTAINHLIKKLAKDSAIFYPGKLIHDKTRFFIDNSHCSVGIFLNRNFQSISSSVVILYDENDDFLLRYARRMMRNNPDVTVHILDMNKINGRSDRITSGINQLNEQFGSRVKVSKNLNSLEKFSFMLISFPTWETLVTKEDSILINMPSTLIINKKVSRFNKAINVSNKVAINPENDEEL